MFQLYKSRTFGDYVSDPIDFFKKQGKHYFKHYFIINGIFLMIFAVIIYFFTKIYMDFFQSTIINRNSSSNVVNDYFSNNAGVFIGTILGMIILGIIISIINYSYPTLYTKLYEQRGTNFETKDIINSIKGNFGRLLLFMLFSIFTMIPLFFIVMVINVFLCFIIIGFPLFFITFPALMSWMSLTFNNYILERKGYFESIGDGYRMLRSNFWPIVGGTLVMFVILYILQTIITMIPYMFGMISMYSVGNDLSNPENQSDFFGSFSIMMIAVMLLSTLVGFTFQNFLHIQQVLIYYSQVENEDLKTSNDEIELIGNDTEN